MRDNNGRDYPIRHHEGILGVRTKSSGFIPDGITNPIPGVDWLAANIKPDAEQ